MRVSSDESQDMPIFTAFAVPAVLSIPARLGQLSRVEIEQPAVYSGQQPWMTSLDDSHLSRVSSRPDNHLREFDGGFGISAVSVWYDG
jgi:hypothetical protein